MTFNGSNIKTADSTPFREGEFIMLFDIRPNPPNGDRGCTMYQITGIAGGSDLAIVNPNSPWNATGRPRPSWCPSTTCRPTPASATWARLTSVRYFIDATGAPDRPPRLMIDDMANPDPPQILAEGIEDMQIAYACDTQPVGNLDGSLSEGTDPGRPGGGRVDLQPGGRRASARLRGAQRHPDHPARPVIEPRQRPDSARRGRAPPATASSPRSRTAWPGRRMLSGTGR